MPTNSPHIPNSKQGFFQNASLTILQHIIKSINHVKQYFLKK